MQIKQQIISRFATVYIGVLVVGVLIVGRALYLQVFEAKKWKAKAESLTLRDMIIEPNRGDIYSVDHKLLATSVPFFEIRMDMRSALPKEVFDKEVDSLALCLSNLFEDKTTTQYLQGLREAYKKGNRYYLLQQKVNYSRLKRLKTFPILRRGRFKGGLIVVQENRRDLPFRGLASRTIGRLKNKGERQDDPTTVEASASIGLEGAYDHVLRGVSGIRMMRKLSNNVWMPVNDANEVEPVDGLDLVSTIDVNIQDVAHNALRRQLVRQKAHHGTAIVMEVATGEIRAISNLRVNPRDTSYQDYYESYNYAVGESTEPGSTFKLASMIAALEDKKLKLTDTIQTFGGEYSFFGFPIRDSKEDGHGMITLQEAFELSSNIGIARAIQRCYGHNPGEFLAALFNMGLNRALELEIKGEGAPYIKSTSDKLWTRVSLAQMSIGYELRLTPLQILTFYNAIANEGKLLRPTFVRGYEKEGRMVKHFAPEVLNPAICSPATVALARKLLEGVVERGTASNIRNSRYKIAGKTGTAKIFDETTKQYISQYKASFVGYFPADKPKYSCFVLISSPRTGLYYGNTVAAPVFKEIADHIYMHELEFQHSVEFVEQPVEAQVPYTKNGYRKELDQLLDALGISHNSAAVAASEWVLTSRTEKGIEYAPRRVDTKTVPLVMGMSAKDALYLLENLGLRVELRGRGSVVEQSVAPGAPLLKGTKIVLELI